MPVRTAGALVFLLLMIEQHNTFSFWNGYQINPKICQNILYSHCFMSQNTCFSFLNSGTAHHFLFLPKEQHTTFSFCQNHGWSILNQSFARFMMGSNYVDPKTVLDNVKSTTWKFFKFRMEGGEVDKNYVFCRLCLDGGNEGKRGQIKYCGGTTIYYIVYKVDSHFSVSNLLFMENYHLSIHMAFWKESMINRLSNLINRNRSAAKISQVLCSSVYNEA